MRVKDIRKIESWHSNGDSIWFYYKSKRVKGINKSTCVPKEYIEHCQRKAVHDFKIRLRDMIKP